MSKTISINAGSSSLKWQLPKCQRNCSLQRVDWNGIGLLKDLFQLLNLMDAQKTLSIRYPGPYTSCKILCWMILPALILSNPTMRLQVWAIALLLVENIKDSALVGTKSFGRRIVLVSNFFITPANAAGIKLEICPNITSVRYLILLSTQPCRKSLSLLFQPNITQKKASANMALMKSSVCGW